MYFNYLDCIIDIYIQAAIQLFRYLGIRFERSANHLEASVVLLFVASY